MSLETLGGFFIAIPLDLVSSWQGDCDGSQHYSVASQCADWISVSPVIPFEHLVFGGDVTSIEVRCLEHRAMVVRILFADDLEAFAGLAAESFGSAEELKTLSFVNGHGSWQIFDSVYAGRDVIDGAAESTALELPLGCIVVETALISAATGEAIVHEFRPA